MFTVGCLVNMSIRHKHLKLDQRKLDKARALLGVATEQETVEVALDILVAEGVILKVHRQVAGVGGFVDAFGSPHRAGRKRRVS